MTCSQLMEATSAKLDVRPLFKPHSYSRVHAFFFFEFNTRMHREGMARLYAIQTKDITIRSLQILRLESKHFWYLR